MEREKQEEKQKENECEKREEMKKEKEEEKGENILLKMSEDYPKLKTIKTVEFIK